MSDPWKVTVCADIDCFANSLDEENNMEVREDRKIYPIEDTPERVMFMCPYCKKSEVWGSEQQGIRKTLYERYTVIK